MLYMKSLVSGVGSASQEPASANSDTVTDWLVTGYPILCNRGWDTRHRKKNKQRIGHPPSDHTIRSE